MQLERDFAAWVDRRDADSLARMFDATAGKLLLLAAHLAGDGHPAQDLVQATFVAAMTHAASWDRARPLWPWLAAILHNELLMQRRRGRRRREVGLEAAADAVATATADPGALAASQEAMGSVLAAIEAMPLPYRQVLRLRLVHGLRPVEIARSLEVPVGTVRAQLHRGLEQLRGVLPAGVAGLVAALLSGESALLAQVRERVIEHAQELAGTGTVAIGAVRVLATGGWWHMNGKTIGVVVAACASVLCLGFLLGAPGGWFRSGDAPKPAVPVAAAIREPAPAPTVAEPPAPAPRLDAGAPAVWPLVVLVHDAAGAPIVGAEVRVWTAPGGSVFWNRESGVFLREDVATGITGNDGCYRDRLTGLRDRSPLWRKTNLLWVEASTKCAEPRSKLLQLPEDLLAEPLTATITLRNACGLTGRIVDAEGSAVAQAGVTVRHDGRVEAWGRTRSNVDGRFFLECRDEERWPEGLVVTEPSLGTTVVEVPARAATPDVVDVGDLVLTTTTANAITGRLVLGDGSALAGFQIRLQEFDPGLGSDLNAIRRWLMEQRRRHEGMEMRDGRAVLLSAQTNSRTDGSFRFAGLDPTRPYLLDIWAVQQVGMVARPGAESVELRVEQQLLTIEVTGEHGEPLPGAAVHLDGYDPAGARPSWKPRPGFPANGQVCGNWLPCGDDAGRRVHLSPFGFVWCLYTTDDHLQPVAMRHEALPGMHRATCRIELRAETHFGKLHLVVVDENGGPLHHGATLKSLERDLSHNDSRMVPPPSGMTWDLPAGRWQLHVLLGKEVAFSNFAESYVRGFHDELVTIEAGRTSEVKVTAAPAGQVAFRLHSAQPPRDIAWGWKGLRIEAAGRAVDVLQYDNEPGMAWTPRGRALPVMFVTKQALPPGRHTFSVTADGYQPVTCEVTIVADVLTTARVEMFAR